MIFKQYCLGCLSHASYLIGDETSGRAVHAVTEGQTLAPLYFAFAASRNKQAREVLHEGELPRGHVVYCAGGYRSMIGASVMRAAGFRDVSDLIGGYGAWEQAGLPGAGRAGAAH